ncbi:MAG: CHASE3 domain-containing protein [Acidobacteriota bacterium]
MNTFIASRSLLTLLHAVQWQAHTLEVISDTEHLVAQMRTSESAARGYILTGDPSFEQQYKDSALTLTQNVNNLQRLTADNPSQQERLGILRHRIYAKLGVLETGISVRRAQPSGPIDSTLLTPVVQDTPDRMVSVQYVITQIEGEEQRLLSIRTHDTSRARTQVWISFIGASLLDILLLVAAFVLLVRTSRDRSRLASSADRIHELNTALTSANADLEHRVDQRTRELALSNQELEAFSYSVSHDLRAPLRTIDGFSLALLEDFADKLDDQGRDYISRVRSGVQRMGTLIDALLQLSRVTRSDLQREHVNLSQLATLVFNELALSDPSRTVAFSATPDVFVEADARLLRIALENLLGNAWKFTSRTPDAKIEFGIVPGKGEFAGKSVYFIHDNGAGFDMQYVDRLFTAFQRLHGDRDFKGSGIGLATVSRIIRRHQGDIWAEGEIGSGATFFFTLEA